MTFSINTIPFSRRKSYFVISKIKDEVYIRDIHGGDVHLGLLFKVEMLDEKKNSIPYHVTCEEHQLSLAYENHEMQIIISTNSQIRMMAKNSIVRLTPVLEKYDHINQLSNKAFELHSYTNEIKVLLNVLQGNIDAHLLWGRTGNTHATIDLYADTMLDVVLERYKVVSPDISSVKKSFEQVREDIFKEYNEWKTRLLANGTMEHDKNAALASYILWSSLVEKEGILPFETMYVSKNWMTNVWSWDNCFNAMALAKHYPELAYQQYILFKKFQDSSGALPDHANDVFASYSCVKPPIHGWAYHIMMNTHTYFLHKTRLLEVYEMLTAMNHYWTKSRKGTYPLPYYNHGNDSGWDNATIFAKGCPVISPDLASYLVLNHEVAGDIALRLGKPVDAQKWHDKAQYLLHVLLEHLYDGKQFYAILYETGEHIESKSLINVMPIILGSRLPVDVLETLVTKLTSAEYFTNYGFATESLASSHHEKKGYWRGPIWPMTTMLLVDGLYQSGRSVLATLAAKRFLNAVRTGGMAENFDPETAEGLDDPAFTVTASAYLFLLDNYDH